MSTSGDKLDRPPHDSRDNYSKEITRQRLDWINEKTGAKAESISHYSFEPNDVRGNIENFVGAAQIPLGIVGPLLVNGEHAKGIFHVPFATTEGAMVNTYSRGAIAITKAGGATVVVHADNNHLDPSFHLNSLTEAGNLARWIAENSTRVKTVANKTTQHGKLLSITPQIIGRRVILDFVYDTADAMGANMINIATEESCEFIAKETGFKEYFLRSNYSSEKKASGAQLVMGCGKSLTAEVVIPNKVLQRYLQTDSKKMAKGWHSWAIASVNAGMLGFNAQYANGLGAMFIACGQDVAHITNGSVGMTLFELTDSGDLYAAVKLPSIIVGTVGGGTALPTQRECLQMIGCYGQGKARKFSEIVAASILAGELGICSALTSKDFLLPHKIARAHTRLKAFAQETAE